MFRRMKRIIKEVRFTAHLNVDDILVNGHPHSISHSAQQVTSLCSQGTRADLPAEHLLF